MPADNDPIRRLFDYLAREGIPQSDLAEKAGIRMASLSEAKRGDNSLDGHWPNIADALNVSLDWLLKGRGVPRPPTESATNTGTRAVIREEGAALEKPKDYRDDARPDYAGPTGPMVFAGSVGAGPGVPTYFEKPKSFKMRPTLAAFRVYGDSAYPVAYDGQFVVVDLKRRIHHNNLVVIQTKDNMAHFKRWCVAPGSPDGFVLASINSGVNSPYIPESEIKNKWPVVGVMFEEEPADGDLDDGQ
jgi:phage repressor protein C with HTH and peptisase S24 domain